MATHDQAELGRGMLGSVTDKVTHSSQVPTLTFPPECAEQHRTSGTVMLRVLVRWMGPD